MSLFNVYPLYQMTPSHAKMCYVYEKNGTKYLDLGISIPLDAKSKSL